MALPDVTVAGEIWLSETARLPDGKKATALPTARLEVQSASPLLKTLTDRLNKQKEIPLRTRITLTRRGRPVRQSDGVVTAGQEQTTIITTTLKSFSTEPLNDGLFQVPTGYTKVDPPSMAPDSSAGYEDPDPQSP